MTLAAQCAKLGLLGAVVAGISCLAACSGQQAVSLGEARAITTKFEGQGFTPPPRTISDITAILDQEKPDPEKTLLRKAIASSEPPPDLKGFALAKFYYGRGGQASELGLLQQWLADNRKALEIGAPFQAEDPTSYALFRFFTAQAEIRLGHLREGIQLLESGSANPGVLLGHYYSIASAQARLGDLAAANATLQKADALLASIPSSPYHGKNHSFVDRAHGEVLNSEGKFPQAEPFLRKGIEDENEAIRQNPGLPQPLRLVVLIVGRDIARRELAFNLARQGRLAEAEVEAREALLSELHEYGRYLPDTADMIGALGVVLAEEGRFSEAAKLQRAAIDVYETLNHPKDSLQLNTARTDLMSALASEGDWQGALQQLDMIRAGLVDDPRLMRRLIGRDLMIVVAALHGGRAADALDLARTALEDRSKAFGDQHYATAEARGFYATALAAKGDSAAALREYQAVLPILLGAAPEVEQAAGAGSARDQRLRFILEGYLGALAARGASPETAAEAFRIADAARGRSVQRALAASAARASVKDPQLADLVRREQDAARQIAALNGLLADAMSRSEAQQDPAAKAELPAEIGQLRQAHKTIRDEIEKRFPDYVNLIEPKPATIAEVQAALKPGEALIATYVADERTFVWAVPKEGRAAFVVAPYSRAELARMVADLRRALEPNASTLGEIPPFDVSLSHKLYAGLLAPVSGGWKGTKSLLVVADGALAQLPLALLVTAPASLPREQEGAALFSPYKKVPWLVRDVAITELPSVASLITLRRVPMPNASRHPFVGFGDPWFSPAMAAAAQKGAEIEVASAETSVSVTTRGLKLRLRSAPQTETVDSAELGQLPRLPETAAEVREVATALKADPAADVFLGAKANERQVRTMKLDDRRVVMFATHGLVPGDLNGLTEPALALSAPQVAGIEGDGLLTMTKVLGLKLDADWVVLSACNTAAGNGAGAEAVSGLGLAFFYAGTRALLVSNWPVETTSARALTTTLFRDEEASSLPRAEALRQAMLALIDGPGYVDRAQNRSLFSYAHPIFWAPFALVGDGGSGVN